MHLAEPVTTLTDYALAVVSLCFALALARSIGPGNKVSAWLWCAAFSAAAAAALLGGTYHGYAGYLPASVRQTLWNLTVFSMGSCAAFVTGGVHAAGIRRNGTFKWLAGGIAVTLLGGMVQQTRFAAGNFNHNDIYHLIQIVGLYLLFRCARTTRDRPANDVAASGRAR